MRNRTCLAVLAFAGLASLFVATAPADVKLPGVISGNMVLQRDADVNIWGWADNGEEVRVACQDQTRTATALDGRWSVKLKPLKAGGPYTIEVAGKSNKIVLSNVLVGEVWVCSGQSNMQWSLSASADAERHIKAANRPTMRLFKAPRVKADEPTQDVKASWVECTPETAKDLTAVGYFFGRDLNEALGVPVGLIESDWGGSPAEVWTKKETIASNPELKSIIDDYAKSYEGYQKALAEYEKAEAEAKQGGGSAPRRPGEPWKYSTLYNAMIAPLAPYAIKGAIWYQGEANAGRAKQYGVLFPAMIQCWRDAWGQGDFTFLAVQLAPFMERQPEPGDSAWAEIREVQQMTAENLKNYGSVSINDVGDEKDIHPKQKEPVGQRLALSARAIAYGQDVVHQGPTFDRMEVKDGKAIVHFKNVGGGLVAKEGDLKGFAIAGADKKFVWGEAKIEGDTVVVSSPKVEEPVAVRYGWANYPDVNFYNKEGIPANPFRTHRD